MSSNYISSVQALDAARLQGVRQVSRVSEPEKTAPMERNESAASGQELPSQSEEQRDTDSRVESAVCQISDFVQNFQRDLHFSVDKDSGRIVVRVLDSETQEVIRTIPPEETLRIAEHLDSPESLMLREQA
jgi:flagellar protein FlaG